MRAYKFSRIPCHRPPAACTHNFNRHRKCCYVLAMLPVFITDADAMSPVLRVGYFSYFTSQSLFLSSLVSLEDSSIGRILRKVNPNAPILRLLVRSVGGNVISAKIFHNSEASMKEPISVRYANRTTLNLFLHLHFSTLSYRFDGHCRLQTEANSRSNMDPNLTLLHFHANMGRRKRHRSKNRQRTDAKTKVIEPSSLSSKPYFVYNHEIFLTDC